MIQTIIFATSNKGKVLWLERALKAAGLQDWRVENRQMDLLEIQSDKIEEISLFKARQAYNILHQPVLVVDGGFFIEELNGFPGPYIRSMIDRMGIDAIGKLVGTLTNRNAHFENVATYIDGNGQAHQFFDSSRSLLTLTDQVWPKDHPQQWSPLWRILVPSGAGYTQPLASFDDAQLDDYLEKRVALLGKGSALSAVVDYLAAQAMKEAA